MMIAEIVELVSAWDGALAHTPVPGDGSPRIAWGDTFFYYAPDGRMPTATQPFATIVTKNYPEDELSLLDRPGVFRVNMHPGRDTFAKWEATAEPDPAALDRIIVHPVYGTLGWLAVLNPGPHATGTVEDLLHEAYTLDRRRYEHRHIERQADDNRGQLGD